MKHILTLIAALLLVPLAARCADADTKTLRVFIFAGQSNMEGRIQKCLLGRDGLSRSIDGGTTLEKVPSETGTAISR